MNASTSTPYVFSVHQPVVSRTIAGWCRRRTTSLLSLMVGIAYVCCPLVSLARADADAPAWKFASGDRFIVANTQVVRRTSRLDSRITIVESDVRLEFSWQVTDVSVAGAATIQQTLERLAIRVGDPAVPRQAIEYASDSDPQDLRSAVRKIQRKTQSLVGLKSTFTMLTNGEIQNLRLDESAKKQLEKVEDMPELHSLLDETALQAGLEKNIIPADISEDRWTVSEDRQDGSTVQHTYQLGPPTTVDNQSVRTIDIETKRMKRAPQDGSSGSAALDKNEITQTITGIHGSGQITFDVDGEYFSQSEYQSRVVSQRQYREKTIATTVETSTRTKIEKQ